MQHRASERRVTQASQIQVSYVAVLERERNPVTIAVVVEVVSVIELFEESLANGARGAHGIPHAHDDRTIDPVNP